MPKDKNWPTRCTLMGCTDPEMRPHHHHMNGGHLLTHACNCEQIDQPGTRRK